MKQQQFEPNSMGFFLWWDHKTTVLLLVKYVLPKFTFSFVLFISNVIYFITNWLFRCQECWRCKQKSKYITKTFYEKKNVNTLKRTRDEFDVEVVIFRLWIGCWAWHLFLRKQIADVNKQIFWFQFWLKRK